MLPDGRYLEAGLKETLARQIGDSCKLAGVTASWEKINFQTSFSSSPAVVTTIQTANNEQGAVPNFFSKPWLTVACQDISTAEVSVALESAETSKVGDITLTEQVGYVAMEVGQSSFSTEAGDVTYSVVLTGAVVKGLDDGETEVGLSADFLANSPLVVGSQVSRNGNNGGWLRLSTTSSSSVHVFVDEDKYCDTERAHIGERASILAFSKAFAVAAAPTTTTTTTFTGSLAGSPTLEVREVTLQSGEWVQVAFTAPFAEVPVVVSAPSAQGDEPAALRFKDITTQGFSAVIAKPSGSSVAHAAMTVTFMAAPPGLHQLPGAPDAHGLAFFRALFLLRSSLSLAVQAAACGSKRGARPPTSWPLPASAGPQEARRVPRDGSGSDVRRAGFLGRRVFLSSGASAAGLATSWQKATFQHQFAEKPAFLTSIQTVSNELGLPSANSQPWFTAARRWLSRFGGFSRLAFSPQLTGSFGMRSCSSGVPP
mgnify:CR=1 FL=1